MNDWLGLLPSICTKYQVDPILVRSIVMVESSGRPWAIRFEKGWKYQLQTKFFADNNHIELDTEYFLQSCSIGIMQIMGSVARERGWSGPLPQLFDPQHGLEMGVKQLAHLMLRYKDLKDVIASYNAGSPIIDIKTGCYKNANYVGKVYGYYLAYKGQK